MSIHISVLLEESLEWLAPKPGDVIVDGTLGLGGHSEKILEKIGPQGKLIGLDKDAEALAEAKKRLTRFGDQAMFIHDDYKNIDKRLKEARIQNVQGMFLDLGVSSLQLDKSERGFSFVKEGPLDMRMNQEFSLTAKKVVNSFTEQQLADIFFKFGQERFSRRIASRIVEARSRNPIETTKHLADIIAEAVPGKYRHGRIHPATRSFQALRIAVNQELEALEEFLSYALNFLSDGGRLVIISFHSLEDKIVKHSFKKFQQERLGKILTKKPIEPTETEASENPRSRSAKLRAFQKDRYKESE